MSKLVTIFGGSGFVGRYIARRMALEGWRVRVAVRTVNEAMFVRPYGVVGQVEPIFCNIRDDASVAAATEGANAVVNCVGLLDEVGKNTFDAVHAEGAERIARIATELNVARMVHVSAIGADENAPSEYGRTKAAGEATVKQHFPGAVILRPSIVFGPEDTFFNRFAGMSRFGPVLPIIGADTRFQPVYVDDVAAAAAKAVMGDAEAGVYELGGPDVLTMRGLIKKMLTVVRRRRLVVNIPFGIARMMAWGFGVGRSLSLGLVKGPVTKDQVKSLTVDNVVTGANGLDSFGIQPTSLDAVLPDYLWRFRPSGQYDAIKESAKNLKA
ncbi:complex I NDUFA9 subunit family protein [Loktanella sp. D2R18]|uniref:complex I NDUFA9 subunit family protein n=1 Tax=Rhodobacterales TaxID=204455 RepID=UPI000DE9BFD9|nr:MULTISPECIES: complex I NDUFA9 subunit family protein [Rhodobacterales]MDO6591360.1 complex I NDUFA9 subunit family protein [Yoonia sp. 1_MG-2023]RBW43567.1 complex I NDUFA9 subunit family protein [Loktanella sp. D2R18]